jgi:hypothetical protein
MMKCGLSQQEASNSQTTWICHLQLQFTMRESYLLNSLFLIRFACGTGESSRRFWDGYVGQETFLHARHRAHTHPHPQTQTHRVWRRLHSLGVDSYALCHWLCPSLILCPNRQITKIPQTGRQKSIGRYASHIENCTLTNCNIIKKVGCLREGCSTDFSRSSPCVAARSS